MHLHPQSDEELVKVDGTTPVAVKLLKQSRGLLFLNQDAVVIQTLQELLQVQGAVVVIIHYFEGSDKQKHGVGMNHLICKVCQVKILLCRMTAIKGLYYNTHCIILSY